MERILYYMFYCHKLPERSFFYKGKQFPICARCTGILVGYIFGIIYSIVVVRINYLGIFLIVPLIIDGLGQLFGKWVSNNRRRFLTGILAGISAIILIQGIAITGYNNGRYIKELLGI